MKERRTRGHVFPDRCVYQGRMDTDTNVLSFVFLLHVISLYVQAQTRRDVSRVQLLKIEQ